MAELTLKEVKIQDLYTILIEMKSSQDQLRKNQETFQTSIHSRIEVLETKLDKRLDSFQKQFQDEIREVKREIDIQTQERGEQLQILNERVGQIESTMKEYPEKCSGPESKLIFKNIKFSDIEDTNDPIYIRTYVEKIIRKLGVEPRLHKVEMLNLTDRTEQPGNNESATRKRSRLVVAVYFRNTEDRSNVLKNKKKLRDIEGLSHIYIEVDKSRYERQTEANIRKLIKSFPTLKMRGGRVINAQDQTPPNQQHVNKSDSA